MILKDTLKAIVKSQAESILLLDKTVERGKFGQIDLDVSHASVISGVRRCGKSTLLRQIMKKTKGFSYFNFEDPRAVNFELEDFQKLDSIFTEEYGIQKYYFFDEIQNVQRWELFVRSVLDNDKRVIITGSNASLLSRELGTRLTGRYIRYELFPFSFREFLTFADKEPSMGAFQEYFIKGGFPEYLKAGKAEILQELLNDIISRDIAIRHKIRSVKTLREMSLYMLTNVGKEFSYNSLKKTFGLGSANSAISFVSYFEDSYLLFTVPKFDYSLRKQIVNPKKVYSIDNGMSNVNSASFSEDKGKMLENMVFINLRKLFKDIFYFQGKNECDFVAKEGTKITKAIQVCYSLDEDNKDREIKGLMEALNKFNLKEGLILTYNQDDEIRAESKRVIVKPVWRWLLGKIP
ncbi:ATP-binding protein [Candidatus Woesearchaeota archaeon]|nr:ATP-binding protein [Candidatus Woesearchaeota archaeon]